MYHVAVIGATGAVGQKMLQVLAELDFPVRQISAYASARSAGKTVQFKGQDVTIQALSEQITEDGIDVALFAAGGPSANSMRRYWLHQVHWSSTIQAPSGCRRISRLSYRK